MAPATSDEEYLRPVLMAAAKRADIGHYIVHDNQGKQTLFETDNANYVEESPQNTMTGLGRARVREFS